MREYKYRGKGIADNEWYFGDLIQTRLGTTWIITEDYTTATEEISLNTCASPQVKAETVGQFTGLHDKNGEEIYEGDVVFIRGDTELLDIKGKVEYSDTFAQFIITNTGNIIDEAEPLGDYEDIEVIGNVFENKELLNETNR